MDLVIGRPPEVSKHAVTKTYMPGPVAVVNKSLVGADFAHDAGNRFLQRQDIAAVCHRVTQVLAQPANKALGCGIIRYSNI